jgi:hypothetical protein
MCREVRATIQYEELDWSWHKRAPVRSQMFSKHTNMKNVIGRDTSVSYSQIFIWTVTKCFLNIPVWRMWLAVTQAWARVRSLSEHQLFSKHDPYLNTKCFPNMILIWTVTKCFLNIPIWRIWLVVTQACISQILIWTVTKCFLWQKPAPVSYLSGHQMFSKHDPYLNSHQMFSVTKACASQLLIRTPNVFQTWSLSEQSPNVF